MLKWSKRPIAAAVLGAGLLAVWALSIVASGTGRALDRTDYTGVYVTTFAEPHLAQAFNDVDLSVVDGVYIRLSWRALERRRGVFNWQGLDAIVDRAVAQGKKISIGVRAGAHSPMWLYNAGVPKLTFTIGHHGGRFGRCQEISLPAPWSEEYLKGFARMMDALAKHLRQRQAYDLVRIVKLTGINQRTEELRLPAMVTERPDSCQTAAVPVWQGAGYAPPKVMAAWKSLSAAINAAFPDKILALEVLENFDFPPFDENGQQVTFQDPRNFDIKQAIVADALQRFPGRFAIQWDGLSAERVVPSVLKAGEAGAIIGWQTNLFKGPKIGSGCESAVVAEAKICTPDTYIKILQNGFANGGKYFEIWPTDAKQHADAVKAFRAQFRPR